VSIAEVSGLKYCQQSIIPEVSVLAGGVYRRTDEEICAGIYGYRY
jgi:hypothetical protein